MQKICTMPVAQALQRHSGSWKSPSPPSETSTCEPAPDAHEQETAPSLQPATPTDPNQR
jgi:hypothetical protein